MSDGGGGGGKKKGKRERNRRSKENRVPRGGGVDETGTKVEDGQLWQGRGRGRRWTCLEGEEGCTPFLFVFQKVGTPFRVVDHLIGPVRLANKLTIDPLANYVPARETRIAVDRFLLGLSRSLPRRGAGNQVDQFLRIFRTGSSRLSPPLSCA